MVEISNLLQQQQSHIIPGMIDKKVEQEKVGSKPLPTARSPYLILTLGAHIGLCGTVIRN
jgi:hypothetical protein